MEAEHARGARSQLRLGALALPDGARVRVLGDDAALELDDGHAVLRRADGPPLRWVAPDCETEPSLRALRAFLRACRAPQLEPDAGPELHAWLDAARRSRSTGRWELA